MSRSKAASPRFTYADYLRWQGEERWELLDGEAVLMTPAPSADHQRAVGALHAQIFTALEGRECEVFVAPFDVRLPERGVRDDQISTVVQPDLSVICDPSKVDERGCFGAPDFVIEVLSPETAARDEVQKLELYDRAGVFEYWLVDPRRRLVRRLVRGGDRLELPDELEAGRAEVRAVAGLLVDVDRVFAVSSQ